VAQMNTALRDGVDWSRLSALAQVHGLIPLLHRHVVAGSVPIPADAARALKTQGEAYARRALRLAGALIEIVDQCSAAGIPVVPLKGPVLAQQIYGALSLRQSRDLDVLVREVDVPRLVRLFQQRGYRLEGRDTPELDALTLRDLHHVTVLHPAHRVRVEIHYWLLRPRGRRRHGVDALSARLQPMMFVGRQVHVLDGEDLLVYLCEHGAEHAWCRLEWLASVAELGRRVDVAHAAASAFARELGTAKRIHAAASLAGSLFNSGEGESSSSRGLRSFAGNRRIIRRLEREPERIIESSAERFFYGLSTDVSIVAVVRRCATMLVAPGIGDARAVPLPRWLAPLHYVLRPFRLIARRLRPHRRSTTPG
jgi:hypothetical protein